jgi:hypothetical protein
MVTSPLTPTSLTSRKSKHALKWPAKFNVELPPPIVLMRSRLDASVLNAVLFDRVWVDEV